MPLTSLTFTCTSDPVEAKAWFADVVAREPVALSVIASVTEGLLLDPSRSLGPRWWAGRDGAGEVVAAFMHTPPHRLHVALATPDQARDLAALLASEGDPLPGVGGRREPAEAFRDAWVELTGVTTSTEMEVGAFDLPDRPVLPYAVPGEFRQARPDELPLVDRWMQDFVDAVQAAPTRAPALDWHVGVGRVGLWVDGGGPVSMAHASAANGGVTRISGVWTPPELRGRGYASGVVAALSNERMDAGERCMLFTDLANPTSNKIYQAMGYRRIGDNIDVGFA